MKDHAHSVVEGFCIAFLRRLVRAVAWLRESLSAPLMGMYFLMLLMNTLLRDTKDTLLVTSQAGVEAIPILKSWAVIPFSFLYFVIYYKVSSLLSPRPLFIAVLLMFNLFYISFALVLFPSQYNLAPTRLTEMLGELLPENAKPLQHLLENWLLGVFYCMSELFASAVCQFMFWQVANDVVSVEEAKSMYPLIGAMGNMGMVCAGYLLRFFANQRDAVTARTYVKLSAGSKRVGEFAAAAQPGQLKMKEEGLFADDVGSNLLNDWFVSLLTSAMSPVDQAWQGSLIGMSLLLGVSSILIVYLYDAVYWRKAQSGAVVLVEPETSYLSVRTSAGQESEALTGVPTIATTTSVSGTQTNVNNGFIMKRRTGSGNYNGASAGAISQDPSAATEGKRYPQADPFWDIKDSHPDGSSNNAIPSPSSRRDSEGVSKKLSAKVKLTLGEGLRTLWRSSPLRSAAVLVISYGISISLVEVSWKGQVKKGLESPNDYSRFMGKFWTMTGLVSMLFMLVGRLILQKVGYAPAVLFTPASMAIAGTLFFIVSIVQDLTGANDVGSDKVVWPAYFGGAAVLFAKSAKYAFFDATKEIIFIPLDDHAKSIGKAAIDVVAYRLSKSGGSFVLQFVILLFGSISSTSGIIPIALVFGIVVLAWILAAIQASKFIQRTSEGVDIPEQHVV